MASTLHKRAIIYLSLILTIGILSPSAIKLVHALYGHSQEKQCVAYGTNHIHSANLDCDFHDFTLASKVMFSSSFTYIPVKAPTFEHWETPYSFIFKPFKKGYQALRGPPQVSLFTVV